MKPHPHAEVLRAIADGVPLSEFEVWRITWERGEWKPGSEFTLWMFEPLKWQVRRKPQHIMVNGFKVPKPLDVMPQRVFWPDVSYESFWDASSPGNSRARIAFDRGLTHATKEAAIAHAKAMLGIDPEYFK